MFTWQIINNILVHQFQGTVPTINNSVAILGVDISNDVQYRRQMEIIAKLANKKLGVLNRAKQYFTAGHMLMLYKAQVRPHMEYYSHLWNIKTLLFGNHSTVMFNVQSSDAVHMYMSEIGARVAARTGRPEDRHHLGKLILHCLKDAPNFILQIDGGTGESETCQSVLQRSVRCANAFRNIGLKTHDAIILMGRNHIHLSIPMYGALYTGVAVACIDMDLTVHEFKDTFGYIIPKMVFCQNERALEVQRALDEVHLKSNIVTFGEVNGFCSFTEFLEKHGDGAIEDFTATDVDPAETLGILMSTSGTTGIPKSAALTHTNLAVGMPYMWLIYDKFPAPTPRMLNLSPLQWFSAIFKSIFSPIFRVTRIQSSLPLTTEHAHFLINKYKPTFILTNPNLLTELLKPGDVEKCDFSCLDTVICGGAAPHKTLLQNFKAVSPNTQIYIAYGMSEVTGLAMNYACQPPGSCGRSLGNLKLRLVNPETMEDITEPNVPGELWMK